MAKVKPDIIANQIKNSDTQKMITTIGVLGGIFWGIKKGNQFWGVAFYGLVGGITGALIANGISKFKNK